MRSGSRSGKNTKKHEILMKNQCETRRLHKHIARCFLQNMRFWRVTIFHGFWSPQSHGKSINSGTFGARGPDCGAPGPNFPDLGWILAAAFFDEFLVGFYIDQNSKIVDTLRTEGRLAANFGSARRNVRGRRGGKEGLKPLRVWQGSWARHLEPRIPGLGNLGSGKTRQELASRI